MKKSLLWHGAISGPNQKSHGIRFVAVQELQNFQKLKTARRHKFKVSTPPQVGGARKIISPGTASNFRKWRHTILCF